MPVFGVDGYPASLRETASYVDLVPILAHGDRVDLTVDVRIPAPAEHIGDIGDDIPVGVERPVEIVAYGGGVGRIDRIKLF